MTSRSLIRFATIAAPLLSAACGGTVGTNLQELPVPVLVSPVRCVGGPCQLEASYRQLAEFDADSQEFNTAAAATYTENRGGTLYRVTEGHYSHSIKNNVARELAHACGARRDAVAVAEIQVGTWFHGSIVGLFKQWVRIHGNTFVPKGE